MTQEDLRHPTSTTENQWPSTSSRPRGYPTGSVCLQQAPVERRSGSSMGHWAVGAITPLPLLLGRRCLVSADQGK
jgi:hypothetical protein